METKRKKVFISYSWDGHEHQQWVLNLAKDLVSKFGIDVILDQFELSAGRDLTHFMENSIGTSDKVLVILTPNYKLKAENRQKGVGYETSMISKEIFESPISDVKFIPILRNGNGQNSTPKFLSSKIYLEMNDDSKYVNKVFELFQTIYDQSPVKKPEFGPIPNMENLDLLDPILDMAKSALTEERINTDLNQIIESQQGVEMFLNETEELKNRLKNKVEFYTSNLDMLFTHEIYRDKVCITGGNYSIVFMWNYTYSNSAKNALLKILCFQGKVILHATYYYDNEPKQLNSEDYKFDLNYSKDVIWRSNNEKFSTDELVQKAFRFIVEKIVEEKKKNFRN